MHAGDGSLRRTRSVTPALVVVDADPQARMATEAALVRRFEPDYRVVTADSPTTGLAALERLASNGEDVALIAADQLSRRTGRGSRRCCSGPSLSSPTRPLHSRDAQTIMSSHTTTEVRRLPGR